MVLQHSLLHSPVMVNGWKSSHTFSVDKYLQTYLLLFVECSSRRYCVLWASSIQCSLMLDASPIAFSTLNFKSGASLTHISSDTSSPLPNPDTILDYVQHRYPNRMSDYYLMVKVRGVYCLLQNLSINQGLVRILEVTREGGSKVMQCPGTPQKTQWWN